MRDLIVRFLEWVDALLLTAPGRHSAAYFGQQDTTATAPRVSAWSKPWSTPKPPHVVARHEPFYDDGHLIRPEYQAYLQRQEKAAKQRQRRRELVWASMGFDYPGTTLRGAVRPH
jgi:hypothetical protein